MAIRKAGSTTECRATRLIQLKTKIRGIHLSERLKRQHQSINLDELDITQDYMYFELGMDQNIDVRLLESMPEYGVMEWNLSLINTLSHLQCLPLHRKYHQLRQFQIATKSYHSSRGIEYLSYSMRDHQRTSLFQLHSLLYKSYQYWV